MEPKLLISVIMPVYNVEKYIRKSIESVLTQTYPRFELIIINDGSTDSSGKICDEYKGKDERIIIKHIENKGVSNARNKGVELAKGKYIYFIDSDDYIGKQMLEELCQEAEKDELDLVITGFNMVYNLNGKEKVYSVKPKEKKFLKLNEMSKELYTYIKSNLINTLWNKLYLREIIKRNNIIFRKKFGEDVFFNVDYMKNIKKVSILESANYYWNRSRKGSETDNIYRNANVFLKEKYDVFLKILELYEVLKINDYKNLKIVYNYYAGRIVQFIQEICANKEINHKQKIKIIKNTIKSENVIKTFKIVKADSFLKKVSYIPIKYKKVFLTYFEGMIINFVKVKFERIFYFIRTRIING